MNQNVKLDSVSLFVAAYLSWAREARVYATVWPLISYRGHACDGWKLLPTLCRQEKLPLQVLRQFETEVVQEFRARFSLTDWTDVEVMAHARHHGAPTRLLDWSRNAFVGLWFAVADKQHDTKPGVVFQLWLPHDASLIALVNGPPRVPAGKDCSCKHPVHVFSSPPRVERTERQRSVFSLASFDGGYALKPLDEICGTKHPSPIRTFAVSPHLKPELRRLLSDLGLDAYSIYGDPDSLGKSLASILDVSDLNISGDIRDDPTDQHTDTGQTVSGTCFDCQPSSASQSSGESREAVTPVTKPIS